MGEFGSLLNLISPQICCYNRISPFLAFFGLYTVSCILVLWKKKAKPSMFGTVLFFFFLGILPVLALFDQYPRQTKISSPTLDLNRAQSMVQNIEKNHLEINNIYCFPYLIYPSTPRIHKMPIQADGLVYLFSNKLNWSINPLSYKSEKILSKVGLLEGLTQVCLFSLYFEAKLTNLG
jgi:hypothetical protein